MSVQRSGEIKIPPSAEREVLPLNADDALRALRELVRPAPALS
jgi:hypothetical protein